MIKSLRWFAVFIASCSIIVALRSATEGDLETRSDALVKASWPADGPGAAVIVTKGGEIVYSGARGLADVKAERPITVDTVFRLASITKQFTAALVLKLADEGKLSLDDPLAKFVPGYPEPGAHATVRQLLNHTSGIQSYTALPSWRITDTARPFTTAELIEEFSDSPAQFEPGTNWAYNNSGYVLLAAVIESVTGQPWHVALRKRITEPLGLSSIRYGVQEDSIRNRALPYSSGPDGVQPAQLIHMSMPSAAGALVGSVRDLARWSAALHHGKVISATSYAEMIAPTTLPNGRTFTYGYGLATGQLRGQKVIGHAGGIFGGATDALYIPERDLFVALFTNSDARPTWPGFVARRLEAMAAPFPELHDLLLIALLVLAAMLTIRQLSRSLAGP